MPRQPRPAIEGCSQDKKSGVRILKQIQQAKNKANRYPRERAVRTTRKVVGEILRATTRIVTMRRQREKRTRKILFKDFADDSFQFSSNFIRT